MTTAGTLQKIGLAAEEQARHYLAMQGLEWVMSNYRSRCGEIDLIMRDRQYLVFVEVRLRKTNTFGEAIASVSYFKRQKIIKTALLYLSTHRLHHKQAVRFDVVGIEGPAAKIVWIKNAFGMC